MEYMETIKNIISWNLDHPGEDNPGREILTKEKKEIYGDICLK